MVGKRRPLSAALLLQRHALSLAGPTRAKAAKKGRAKVPEARTPSKAARVVRPAPKTFVEGRYGPHGRLTYKLYMPQGSTRRRLPVVVMLHGCGQSAADFARGTGMNRLADELGFIVLYPEQSTSANVGRCWNWHRPGDQNRGSGEPAAIADLTRQIISLCKANPARVYIAGMSAGAAAAAVIGAAYPELFVAVGVHSGLACGNVTTLTGAMSAMRRGIAPGRDVVGKTARPLPTIVFHGDRDSTVHPSNAMGFLSQLKRSTARPLTSRQRQGRSPGGRSFTRTEYRQGAGPVLLEEWVVHGSGHAWCGGHGSGSHTDPAGPDASREMVRFFLAQKRPIASCTLAKVSA